MPRSRQLARSALITTCLVATALVPAAAQVGASIGAGIGVAGSTDESLSNGQTGLILSGQVTTSPVPVIKLGAEVDHLQHTGASATFGTAIVELHAPVLPFFVKAGVGYGHADVNDSRGAASGVAFQIGVGYDLGIPAIPVGFALFGNAYFAHGSSRNAQMVDGGLSIRFP